VEYIAVPIILDVVVFLMIFLTEHIIRS
jgi:hypothetical protein